MKEVSMTDLLDTNQIKNLCIDRLATDFPAMTGAELGKSLETGARTLETGDRTLETGARRIETGNHTVETGTDRRV